MPSQGKYGLWDNRPTKRQPRLLGFVDSGESSEDFAKQKEQLRKKDAANRCLNERSGKVREAMETRLWATMYLQYLVGRLCTTERVRIRFDDVPDLAKLSLNDAAPSPSSEVLPEHSLQHLLVEHQAQILDRRLLDARIGTEETWATLNQLVCHLASEISQSPSDSCIAFRVFDDESQSRYSPKEGIRCGNWQDFNVNHYLTKVAGKKHVECNQNPTDYISISTSPRRLWNYANRKECPDQKIAVIDLRVLDRLGIAYGSTTEDLWLSTPKDGRTEYATKHHVLVVGWIPSRSILGFLSKEKFRELLKESEFDISGEVEILEAEYDRKIPYHRISRLFE